MTASTYFTLYCDGHKLGYTAPEIAKDLPACRFVIDTEETDLNAARFAAAEQGWKEAHQNNQIYDICPDHASTETEPEHD